MDTRKELYSALVEVKRRVDSGNLPLYGICSGVREELRGRPGSYKDDSDVLELLRSTYQKWPKFSGDSVFPIKDPQRHVSAEKKFVSARSYWKGAYGDARRSLLSWLIFHLQPEDES